MRFNNIEMANFATCKSDREGRLNYKSPNSYREGYKERWFKLKGNLLFYFRLNSYGGVYEKHPVGMFIIENCRVQMEGVTEQSFAFSIVFLDDDDKKHMFSGPTTQHCEQWVKALSEASYEYQRSRYMALKNKISQKQSQLQKPRELYQSQKPQSTGNLIDI